jgi:hypothetical protein
MGIGALLGATLMLPYARWQVIGSHVITLRVGRPRHDTAQTNFQKKVAQVNRSIYLIGHFSDS